MNRKLFAIALLVLASVPLGVVNAGANPSRQAALFAVQGGPAASPGPLAPVGSGFTYQGRLLDGGNPANGQYDLRFTLFDALTGGNQVGTPVTLSNQTVTNGLFTVTLDFGAATFRGDARFLQIEVQRNGGGFVLLSPRQPLTPAPYAMSLMPGAVISATTTSNVFTVSNNGSGIGIRGSSTSSSGVEGDSVSGSGVTGFTSSSTSGAVSGTNLGSGPGVVGTNPSGTGVLATGGNGVFSTGVANNGAGVWGIANTGPNAAGVYGTSSSGRGVWGISTANNGIGTYGRADTGPVAVGAYGTSSSGYGVGGVSTANDGIGVVGKADTGTAAVGVYGISGSGTGVEGLGVLGVRGATESTVGAGVLAQGVGSTTTALKIENGAIRVTNAGAANQPVFIHTIGNNNICNGTNFGFSRIDNVYADGDPNAILIVTSREDFGVMNVAPPVGVAYFPNNSPCGLGDNKWYIETADGANFSGNLRYNVMVIKP